jgi:hypothetical protein
MASLRAKRWQNGWHRAAGSAGSGRRKGANGRVGLATGCCEMTVDPLVIFTPSGKRGRFAAGTTGPCGRAPAGGRPRFGLRRAGHLLALPGEPWPGATSPSTASTVEASALSPMERRSRSATLQVRDAQAGPAPRLPGDDRGRRGHRRSPRKPGAQAGGPQGRGHERTVEMDPATRLLFVEVAEPDMHEPSGDFERLARPRCATGRHRADLEARLSVLADPCSPRCARAAGQVTLAAPQGHRDARAGLRSTCSAGLLRGPPLRPGRRRGLDHHRRTSDRPAQRHRRGRLGRDEPADPLRRGSDEPGELRDDEPGAARPR